MAVVEFVIFYDLQVECLYNETSDTFVLIESLNRSVKI